MESLKLKSDLVNCRIRKEWVKATPEEGVRQNLLNYMIDCLGFPPSLISLEKGLDQMPHLALSQKAIPNRRADLVCYAENIHPAHPLYPLIVIECKAVDLKRKELNQVLSYNHFLGAHFVALVNQKKIMTGWHDKDLGEYRFIDYLPSFSSLLKSVSSSTLN